MLCDLRWVQAVKNIRLAKRKFQVFVSRQKEGATARRPLTFESLQSPCAVFVVALMCV